MADVTTILEFIAVFIVLTVMFYIVYKYISGYEVSRKNASGKVGDNLAKMIDRYELRGGIRIQFSVINQTIPLDVNLTDYVKGFTVAPVEKLFIKATKVKLGDGWAKVSIDGKAYDYECTKKPLGSNVEMMFCGVKGIRFKDALVSSVVMGVISDGKFAGSVTFTLKG